MFGKTIQPNVPFHTDAPLKTGRPSPRLGEGGDEGWSTSTVRPELGVDEIRFEAAAKMRTATDLLGALEAEAVPCDRVTIEDAMNRFFDDPLNRELGLVSALPQPTYGIVE